MSTRNQRWSGMLTLLIASCGSSCMAKAEEVAKPTAEMQKLAPGASGLALVLVTEMKIVDERPNDGSLMLVVSLKLLKSTGTTRDTIYIIKEPGGTSPNRRPGPYQPVGPVKTDTFTLGKKYWVAFASNYPDEKLPQRVVKVWPENEAPKELAEAIKADEYVRRPMTDPRNGFTHGWLPDPENNRWNIRMEKEGKRLWERSLPGEKFGGNDPYSGQWSLLHLDQWHSGLLDAERTKSNWYLFAETLTELNKDNPYQRPAGKYRIVYILEAETGKTVSVRVSRPDSADANVVHFYEINTGKIRREERYDYMETGGKAMGADKEGWLRKLTRQYDLATGKLLLEETFRHASTPKGSMFVPVKK